MYCIPPPRILVNICCPGIDSSSKRVVLGHRCHSSISRKYFRPRVRRWGARSNFIYFMRGTSKQLCCFRSMLVCILVPNVTSQHLLLFSHNNLLRIPKCCVQLMFWPCKVSISLFLFLLLIYTDTTRTITCYVGNMPVSVWNTVFWKGLCISPKAAGILH